MTQKTTPTDPATYIVSISPQYIQENYKNGTQTSLVNAGGTMTIGVSSSFSDAALIGDCAMSESGQISPIEGGFAITWNLDASGLDNLETMHIGFTFKDTTKGNVSWNNFSLDYQPAQGAPISGKNLPIVYIKSDKGFFQNNINEAMYDDFVLGGPGLTTNSTFAKDTIFGPSGAALNHSIKFIQVFDTIELQPVYLVEPQPVSNPKNFIFRGDRPLGLYKVDGVPQHFNPDWKVTDQKFQTVANNQMIDFAKLYEFMNTRLKEQFSTSASLPTKINLLDVSITDLNQRFANIPSTDLPYQELRSFSDTIKPATSVSQYTKALNDANLNTKHPSTSTIGKVDVNGTEVSYSVNSKFSWVDLGTTKNPSYTAGKTSKEYAADLLSMYNLDAAAFHSFINEVINWRNQSVDAGTANVVYMHCNAGTMRTGTFLTCLLLTQYPDISMERAANYGKSLFGDDAGTVRIIAKIDDYWQLVQNYCAYLDLVTNNPNPRTPGIAEPTADVFTTEKAYEDNPNPWQWQQTNS